MSRLRRAVLVVSSAATLIAVAVMTPIWAQGAAAVTGPELIAAGDIGDCATTAGAAATAALVGASSGTVAPLGDANGADISLAQYQQCYGPRWGQYLSRTRPAVGNRDVEVSGPTGYYSYFGASAGPAGKGYYSYSLGTWHIVVLNSSCARAGGCAAGSPQESWLRADLAAHPGMCTLAYWHRPLFTSGSVHAASASVRPLFQALYDAQADVVINAHNEQYERFAPQTPTGAASPNRGIRQFVVGTGGWGHEPFGTIAANSEVRNSTTFGVLTMTLGTGAFSWQFQPIAGQTFTDTGTGTCHRVSPSPSPSPSGSPTPSPSPSPSPSPTPTPPPGTATLLAAGDISTCSNTNDTATANLIKARSGTVAAIGDLAYENGTAAVFANCYNPTWGQFKDRTRPVPGNHEYNTAGAAPYYNYFGAAAGPRGQGYYSYDLGSWHIVALNSQCSDVGGCGAGSPQERWLRADLAAHPALCTLAYIHQGPFSSGATHDGVAAVRPLFQALYDNHAEVVLSGHEHNYERFAPQTPARVASPTGVRAFVVGTGGRSHYSFGTISPNSQVRNNTTYGVLQLTLDQGTYSWRFLPVAGQTFTDTGSDTCH
jgi:hypothetical protein